MSEYRVWIPDEGEGEDDAKTVRGYSEEDAVKTEVERRYNDDPFSSAMTAYVRSPEGELKCYEVHPEPTISFDAYEVDL